MSNLDYDCIKIKIINNNIDVYYNLLHVRVHNINDLLDMFHIDMFTENYNDYKSKLSKLIVYLNNDNIYRRYNVVIRVIGKEFSDFVDVKNGTYYVDGTFELDGCKKKKIKD